MSFVRADLMMAARPGTDPAELEGLLAGSARRALAGPGGRTGVRVAVPARTRTAGSTPAAAGQSNAAAARFDAVVSAGAPSAAPDEVAAVLRDIAADVAHLVDPAASAALSGTVTVLIPGEGPYFTLYPLRRAPALSSEEFHEYWLRRHGALARRVPGLSGYRQFHAEPGATARLAELLSAGIRDFDGSAEGRRVSPDAVAVRHGPEIDAVLADEQNFIDLARCGPTLYRSAFGAEAFGG